MQYTLYESEQHVFDKSLSGLFLVGKILFKTLLYLPILFSGYWLATTVLNKEDAAALWMATVLLFAYGLFCSVYCLKGILLACREAGNLLWVPILALCIAFTCIAPAWFVFHAIEPLLLRLSPGAGSLFTWIISGSAAIYLYSRYNFLKDQAPVVAWPAYWLGNQFIPSITRLRA